LEQQAFCCTQEVQSISLDCSRVKRWCCLIFDKGDHNSVAGSQQSFSVLAVAMSQQLFAPTSSSSRRSASSKGSGMSDWLKVSGTSGGLGTKKAGLFLWDVKRPCCLGLIGSENLLVCGKPVGECGMTHQGGQFDPESPMEDLVFIHNPKLATRFLMTPFAQRE
jgi:hypothetical protein